MKPLGEECPGQIGEGLQIDKEKRHFFLFFLKIQQDKWVSFHQ